MFTPRCFTVPFRRTRSVCFQSALEVCVTLWELEHNKESHAATIVKIANVFLSVFFVFLKRYVIILWKFWVVSQFLEFLTLSSAAVWYIIFFSPHCGSLDAPTAPGGCLPLRPSGVILQEVDSLKSCFNSFFCPQQSHLVTRSTYRRCHFNVFALFMLKLQFPDALGEKKHNFSRVLFRNWFVCTCVTVRSCTSVF